MPPNPPSNAHGFAMRSMSLRDMQIPKSEKKNSWPPPLPNPGDAPAFPVQYTISFPVQYTISFPVQYTISFPVQYTLSFPVQYTISLSSAQCGLHLRGINLHIS